MGNEPPKKNYQPRLEKQRLEIACIKVVGHLELQRDRRQGQGNQKEKALCQMISAPQRSKVDELHKASSIVSDMFYIQGVNIVIRYLGIIKDRSLLICESVGNPQNIEELLPFIESVIWSARYLNLNAMQEFQALILNFFGAQGIDVTTSPKVDQELKKYFETVMPTPQDINDYIIKLCMKTGMTLEQINSVGHQFSDKPPQPPQPPSTFNQPPQNNNVDQPPQNPQQGGQGPANVGGYFPVGNDGQQGGPGGQVINVNVQIPPNYQQQQQQQSYNNQQQQYQQQNQFNQPPQQYQQQQNQFNQPPQNQNNYPQMSQNQGQVQQPSQNQFQQPSQNQFQQPSQNQFQQPQQQNQFQTPQQQNQFQSPNMSNITTKSNQTNVSNPFEGCQNQNVPQNSSNNNNSNTGFNQPPQNNNQFNQPPQNPSQNQPPQNPSQNQPPQNQPPQQQQNQFQQAPQYQKPPGANQDIDSLEERLKRLREGV